jgi:hypothetical protein
MSWSAGLRHVPPCGAQGSHYKRNARVIAEIFALSLRVPVVSRTPTVYKPDSGAQPVDLRSAIARIPFAGAWFGLNRDFRVKELFDRVYKEHRWPGRESKSGPGSSIHQTAVVRDQLSKLVAELHITSVLDIPCGDFNWMQHVDLQSAHYIGADIVESMIAFNSFQFATPMREFGVIDPNPRPPPPGGFDFLPRLSGASLESPHS